MTYTHKINTTLGIFSFRWVRSENKKDWWIAGIFDVPAKAKKAYTCNPFSGKYNFHGFSEPALVQLMDHLEDLKNNGMLI